MARRIGSAIPAMAAAVIVLIASCGGGGAGGGDGGGGDGGGGDGGGGDQSRMLTVDDVGKIVLQPAEAPRGRPMTAETPGWLLRRC